MTDLYIDTRSEIQQANAYNEVWQTFIQEWETASDSKKEEMKKKYGPLIAKEIPKFHEEVKENGGLPPGFSESMKDLAYTCLKTGYAVARVQTWKKAQSMRDNEPLVPWMAQGSYSKILTKENSDMELVFYYINISSWTSVLVRS
jgi:hypothetical protein